MRTLCLYWMDACLVGVLSDKDKGAVSVERVWMQAGRTDMPFNALRASAFTRATCSMATCTLCLNSSGEFGSARVDVELAVEAGKLDEGIARENVEDWDAWDVAVVKDCWLELIAASMASTDPIANVVSESPRSPLSLLRPQQHVQCALPS